MRRFINLVESSNEILLRDETNPLVPDGHVVERVPITSSMRWTEVRRLILDLGDELPSIRFQVLNRLERDAAVMVMGLSEEVRIVLERIAAYSEEAERMRAPLPPRFDSAADAWAAVEAERIADPVRRRKSPLPK